MIPKIPHIFIEMNYFSYYPLPEWHAYKIHHKGLEMSVFICIVKIHPSITFNYLKSFLLFHMIHNLMHYALCIAFSFSFLSFVVLMCESRAFCFLLYNNPDAPGDNICSNIAQIQLPKQ